MVKPLERNTRYVDAVLTVGIRMRCNWVLRDIPLECCVSFLLLPPSSGAQGRPVPHVQHEPCIRPGGHRTGHVLRTLVRMRAWRSGR